MRSVAQIKEPLLATTDLHDVINSASVIDTHVHLGLEGIDPPIPLDGLVRRTILSCYSWTALAAAGIMDPNQPLGQMPIGELIEKLRTHGHCVAATGTYSASLEALRDLYDFGGDFSDAAAVDKLLSDVKAAYAGGEQKRWEVLFEAANVEFALKNVQLPYFTKFLPSLDDPLRKLETKLIKPVPRVDYFLFGPFAGIDGNEMLTETQPMWIAALQAAKEQFNCEPQSLKEYLELIEQSFDFCRQQGAVAMKLTIAYVRSLSFDDPPADRAAAIFAMRDKPVTIESIKPFQDYVLRFVLEQCIAHDLPLQIHTGLQAGLDANLDECNPTLLSNLFRDKRYSKLKFMLLHGGYPYISESAVLARSFPNVFLDFAWLPILSPAVARRCLSEWLQLVPANKLMHGADVNTAEEVYAVTKRVRSLLGDVLGGMVASGYIKERNAIAIARGILRDNAKAAYKLYQ